MSFVKITILIITFNFLRISEMAEYNRFAVVEKREYMIKACGPTLADILSKACSGQYNDQKKRGDYKTDNLIRDSDSEYYDSYETNPEVIGPYPFRSKRSVSSMLSSSRLKRKHGLVDECCKKACTMDELKSYCG